MKHKANAIKGILAREKIVDEYDFLEWIKNSEDEKTKDYRIKLLFSAFLEQLEILDRIVNLAE